MHEKALTDSLREQGHGAGETSHARKASQYTLELGYTTLAHWVCSCSAASSCVGGLGWLLSQMADFVVPLYVTALEPRGEPYTVRKLLMLRVKIRNQSLKIFIRYAANLAEA